MTKNILGIKLGDKIHRAKVDSYGMLIGKKSNDYRVVGLNPNLKLQEVFYIKGFDELGTIQEFDWSVSKHLRPMFPDNHFIYKLDDSDWSHIWIGDF
jgi:hypothetical protein